jgi:S1-C subfamily serine protease
MRKISVFKPFIYLALVVAVVSLACSGGGSQPAVPDEPAQTAEPAPVKTQAPMKTTAPEEPAQPEGLITDLGEAEKAVVLIEMEGTYVDPEVGLQVNAGGTGTGFIIDPEGIAVTNNHVVTGAALVRVYMNGESSPRNAKVLGVSECSDLAVIDIDGDGYPYLQWLDGDIKAATDIFAAGYPGSVAGKDYTITEGIVSTPSTSLDSVWASVSDVIKHTAKVNPGNSGGPLLTQDAQVVGVNYATVSSTDENYSISKDIAADLVEKLRNGEGQDTIGVNGVAVTGELNGEPLSGIWVRSVESGSPADQAGLTGGDIIYQLEGEVLATDGTFQSYCDILKSHNPSDTLSMRVIRFNTGEVLDGQLNGRQLETAFVFGQSSGDNSNTSGDNSNTSGENTNTSGENTNSGQANPNASEPGELYYYNDFSGELGDWEYFLLKGNENDFTNEVAGGKFRTEITARDTWVYYIYKDYIYTNTQLEITSENLGANTNYVGLVCRYSDRGWYELNVLNTGEYFVYGYDSANDRLRLLYNGGSTLIETGKSTNTYTFVCDGDQLTVGINGVEVRTISMKLQGMPFLEEGQVGLSVSSGNPLPVIVELDDFRVGVPY